MNWEQLRKRYIDSLDRLNAKSYINALKGLDELEAVIIKFFPEAYKNPLILGSYWDYVRDRFGDIFWDKKWFTRRCHDALRRAIKVVTKESNQVFREWSTKSHFSYEKQNQMFTIFKEKFGLNEPEEKEILKNIWANILIGKNNKKILVKVIPPFVFSPDIIKEYLLTDYYEKLVRAMTELIERKIFDKHIVPVVLISYDEDTMATAKKHLRYFKKLGIKVYAIARDEDVVEV